MCRGPVPLVGLLVCLLGGCFTSAPLRSGGYKDQLPGVDALNAAGLFQIEVRLIETRFGDPFVSKELWDTAVDQLAVDDFEQRGPLARNGLRVGRVAAAVPPRLQELMTLERSCLNPRLLLLAAGRSSTIHLGPVRPECRYVVEQQGQATAVELAQAQFSLCVEPSLTDDGNVRLHMTPKVEYGDDISTFLPTQDRSGWVMERKRPSHVYSELSWDVTLGSNTLLVIGGSLDDTGSLGYQAFVDRDSAPPVHRLLVLRTGRPADAGLDSQIAPTPAGTSVLAPPTPLAQQAAQPLYRAKGH